MPASPAAASAAPGPAPHAHPAASKRPYIWQPCARDSGNKIAVSAHCMREVQTLAFAGHRWPIGVTGATSCAEHFAQDPQEAPCCRTRRRRRAKNRLREREAVSRRQAVSIVAPSTRAPPASATVLPPPLILDGNRSDPGGRSAMVHSVRAQRSRAEETHRSSAIGQRSYAQPPIPTPPAPRAPVSGLLLHSFSRVVSHRRHVPWRTARGADAAMRRGDGSRRSDAAWLPAHTAVMSRGALPGSQLQHTCAAHPAEVRVFVAPQLRMSFQDAKAQRRPAAPPTRPAVPPSGCTPWSSP
jgi:hypothetical protein